MPFSNIHELPLALVCPSDYEEFEGRCYFVSKDTITSWLDARKACRAQGGDLAVPSSASVNQFIWGLMRKHQSPNAYIGMYRVAEGLGENMFYTAFGTEPSYTNWASGEPNNFENLGEDCVEMYSSGGKWNDLVCSERTRSFVCQMCFQRCDS